MASLGDLKLNFALQSAIELKFSLQNIHGIKKLNMVSLGLMEGLTN